MLLKNITPSLITTSLATTRHTASHKGVNGVKGVTLIELLVVITIMMTMVALVAPLAINTVDKAEAQSEYLDFCGILRRASIKAFVNGSGITVTLEQNKLTVFIIPLTLGHNQRLNPIENKVIVERSYEYLTFPETEIKFNRNGMPNLTTISLTQRKKTRQLDLISLLEH
ncbi:MAG: hypothetical protein JJV99_03685 [Colwellia sp.]|nr:hypothetical protein [Colwellia sp.]